MAQAPPQDTDSLTARTSAVRRSTKRLLNAARDLGRDLAKFEEKLESDLHKYGIGLEIQDPTTAPDGGEGDIPE